jgi:hypothetical protein
MKKISKFLVLAIVMIAFASSTFAQVSATATATAVVITPLTISATTPLDFGSFASTSGADVIVAQNNARTVSGAGVFLVGGTPTAAVFTITGNGGSQIGITLPPLPVTLNGSVSGTMDITAISPSIPAGNYTILGAAGPQTTTLTIGATLTVGAAQAAGTYTNTTDFTVTVNYN